MSSHDPVQAATAQFRELQNNVGGTLGTTPTAFEPLGPSSRRTGLTISEIHYHPGPRGDGKELEFVELFNSNPFFEDLSGYRLSGAIDYTFANGTTIPGGGFLVVARVPADVMGVYGLSGVLGPYVNNLPNDRGTVRLRNGRDAVLLEVNYESQPPWPIAPDGAGHSLVLARPSYGEENALAWDQSDQIGGSPGGPDPIGWDALRNVVINEFLAHTDPPDEDFIELYNHSNQSVNLSGCFLSDDLQIQKAKHECKRETTDHDCTNKPHSSRKFFAYRPLLEQFEC